MGLKIILKISDMNEPLPQASSLHALSLLSDSALPIGSFAFSSGLESFLAHNKHRLNGSKTQELNIFLEQSIANLASTALPYVLAGFTFPEQLESLDNDLDASTPCTVARRASVSQGRALATIWERAFRDSVSSSEHAKNAAERLDSFAAALKYPVPDRFGLPVNGHYAPLFGAVSRAFGLESQDAVYLFLMNHAKAVLSAAVRANVIGPYQSQAMLSSGRLQGWIRACIKRESERHVEDVAVTYPMMDLWMGRHELLYSRIFNS